MSNKIEIDDNELEFGRLLIVVGEFNFPYKRLKELLNCKKLKLVKFDRYKKDNAEFFLYNAMSAGIGFEDENLEGKEIKIYKVSNDANIEALILTAQNNSIYSTSFTALEFKRFYNAVAIQHQLQKLKLNIENIANTHKNLLSSFKTDKLYKNCNMNKQTRTIDKLAKSYQAQALSVSFDAIREGLSNKWC